MKNESSDQQGTEECRVLSVYVHQLVLHACPDNSRFRYTILTNLFNEIRAQAVKSKSTYSRVYNQFRALRNECEELAASLPMSTLLSAQKRKRSSRSVTNLSSMSLRESKKKREALLQLVQARGQGRSFTQG